MITAARDGGHVRESAAAKRSDTSHARRTQKKHESPINVNLHDEHSGRRAHQGGSLGKARLTDAVKKQTERPQAGRARREKIRLVRDPPGGSRHVSHARLLKGPTTGRLGSPAYLS